MRLLDGQLVLSPSDLTKFTRCTHATSLDIGKLRGTLKPLAPPQRSLHTNFISEKGTQHELTYIERLAIAGNEVVSIKSGDLRAGAGETIAAMKRGAPYINQAVFFDGKWTGRADLLERVGDGRYEVVDLKLARSPKPWSLLQLAAYISSASRTPAPTRCT